MSVDWLRGKMLLYPHTSHDNWNAKLKENKKYLQQYKKEGRPSSLLILTNLPFNVKC